MATVSEWKRTACILCECNCGIEVRLGDDGGFERIRGDKAHPMSRGYTCEKALRLGHYQSSNDRLTSPLRRRPDGTFEAIGWDTAIEEVAAKFAQIRDAHGGETIVYYGGGGQGNHLGGTYSTATRAALGSRFRSSALAQEKTGEFWVNHRMFGASVRGDFEHTDLAVFIGKNPWQSHSIPQARRTLKEIAADSDRHMIVIDTRRTETAELADLFLQVKPGTDAYCLAAIAALLVERNAIDRPFLDQHTNGFDEVAEVIRQVDVDDYAQRCGIPRTQLERAAELMGAAGSMAVFEDLGVQQAPNSTLVSYLEKLVWLLTGNFGKPGGQYIPTGLVDFANGREGRQRSPVTQSRVIGGMIPSNVIADEILTDHPRRFRAMLVESANPAHSLAGSARFREALDALELVVVIDIALTETARHADYVLPAATQYEKWEATFFNFEFPDNGFHLRAPVLAPAPGTLTEPEIHVRLCEALDSLDSGLVAELETLASSDPLAFAGRFVEATTSNPSTGRMAPVLLWKALGPVLEQAYGPGAASAAALWGLAHRAAMVNRQSVVAAGHVGDGPLLGEALFAAMMSSPSGMVVTSDAWDQTWARIRTEHGRINLALPDLLEELASLAGRDHRLTSTEYPFVLAAGERRSFTANTIIRDPGWRKRDHEGALRINPDDADALALAAGDRVRVITAAGALTTVVEVTDTLQPGNITLPNGMGTDYPVDDERHPIGVSPNELTTTGGHYQDPFAGTPFHKHVPARLEPVT